MNIIFLCTGNTCRSPMAAALFIACGSAENNVMSAGLCAVDGQPAAAHMQTLAGEFGVDLSNHRSSTLTQHLLDWADIFVCLSASHARQLAQQAAPKKIRILGGGVADPYGGSLDVYRACAQQMQAALPALAKELRSSAICQIIPTTEAHLPALAALEQAVFPRPASEARLREKFKAPHAHLLTAFCHAEIAGFIGVDEISGEAFIDDVAVFPDFQRKGIGSALLARAETAAVLRGCEVIHLEVRENSPARALYASRGYREVGRRKGFYEKPKEDAILMTLFVT